MEFARHPEGEIATELFEAQGLWNWFSFFQHPFDDGSHYVLDFSQRLSSGYAVSSERGKFQAAGDMDLILFRPLDSERVFLCCYVFELIIVFSQFSQRSYHGFSSYIHALMTAYSLSSYQDV
jgi:hypothetical protein